MVRICLLIGLALMLLDSIGGAVGCGKGGISGTYVNEDNPDEYMELNADGTFYLKERGLASNGEWQVKDNELRLSWIGGVLTATAEIRGNKLTDNEGKVWVKQ